MNDAMMTKTVQEENARTKRSGRSGGVGKEEGDDNSGQGPQANWPGDCLVTDMLQELPKKKGQKRMSSTSSVEHFTFGLREEACWEVGGGDSKRPEPSH